MHQTSLSDEELDLITPLVDSICAEYGSVEDPRLIEMAPRYARELPVRLRRFFEEFRAGAPAAFCILSNFPVDDDAIGTTPAHPDVVQTDSLVLSQEVFFLLCATLLGDVSADATRWGDRIMHDVVPVKGNDAGSEMSLGWRTEDAASASKADYVGLMCLRNPHDVATTICDGDWIDWSKIDVDLLFQPEYPIGPADRVTDVREIAPKQPVLFGDRERPSLSLDPDVMVRDQMAPAALAAFDAFTRAVDAALNGVVLWPGDIAFISNLRAVHGQEPFDARYDGTDRWLKRLKIAGIHACREPTAVSPEAPGLRRSASAWPTSGHSGGKRRARDPRETP